MYLCLLCSDWCISRQLWWGHQIPAYQVELPNSTDKQEVGSVDVCMFYYFSKRFSSCVVFWVVLVLSFSATLN